MWIGRNCRFEAWKRVKNREGAVYTPVPRKLIGKLLKHLTYIKFLSILNRLIKQKHSIPCRKGFKSTIEVQYFYM